MKIEYKRDHVVDDIKVDFYIPKKYYYIELILIFKANCFSSF